MKRKTLYFIGIASLLFSLSGCKEENIISYPYTTHSALSLVYEQDINEQTMKGIAGIAYNPVGFRCSGDTLFVANRANGADGVLVLRKSTGELIKSITSWTFNEKKETFDNQVMDVAVNADYIFVVNRSSRIDMFRRNDFSYLTTIGKTGWQTSPLLQCESADVSGDKLFVRDKHRIQVVNLADCTPANRFKVPIFAVSADSTAANNGFAAESVLAHNGKVYVTDYVTSRIQVIDPATVTTKGEKIKFLRSYRTQSRPLGMGIYKDDLFVACENNQIFRLNLESGKMQEIFASFAGNRPWGTTTRIRFCSDTFYLSGFTGSNLQNGSLRQGKVMYIDFSELD